MAKCLWRKKTVLLPHHLECSKAHFKKSCFSLLTEAHNGINLADSTNQVPLVFLLHKKGGKCSRLRSDTAGMTLRERERLKGENGMENRRLNAEEEGGKRWHDHYNYV